MNKKLLGSAVVLVALGGCAGREVRPGIQQSVQQTRSVASPTVTQPTQVQLLGDLDKDGNATVGDAIKVLRIVVGLDADESCTDANQNGGTDVGDAIRVVRCVVDLDDWPTGVCSGTGKVAFYSDRDGNAEIYVMNTDGSGQTNLTNNPGDDYRSACLLTAARLFLRAIATVNLCFHVRVGDGEISQQASL